MKKINNILVTGGAGYIGSHIVEKLVKTNVNVFILDNLVTGYKRLINKKAFFDKGSITDTNKIKEIITKNNIDTIIHLAAYLNISEAENSDYYSAINDCNKAIELDSQNDNAYNNLGNAKNKLGDLKGACNDWEIARKMGGNIFAENSLKKFCN